MHVRDIVAKTRRLAADTFAVPIATARSNYGQVFDLVESEFPDANTYPFGSTFHVWRLVGEKLVAGLLAPEFARTFVGLTVADLDRLVDSFRFEECDIDERFVLQLTHAARPR